MTIVYGAEGVTVFQSALFATTSTVVETKDLVLVADPTWLPGEVEEIRRLVADIRGSKPLYLLFTHSDWDHVLGYGAFADADAVAIASRGTAEYPDQAGVLRQIAEFDNKYYISRNYPVSYPRIDIMVDRDGYCLEVGDTRLTFYPAPGHTSDGLFTVVENAGVLIAGDYLSDVEFPFIYDGSEAYERTMEKLPDILGRHRISLTVPGHGNPTDSVDEALERQRSSLAYIQSTRAAVAAGKETETFDALARYRFAGGMRSAHEDNLRLIRRELGAK
jgi:hydroxyacylglutathione hydrolase